MVARNYETDRNGTKRTGKARMVAAWRQPNGSKWFVKPQISKFKAEKSCQVGFNVLRRLYS
jgi:hypothetical protein